MGKCHRRISGSRDRRYFVFNVKGDDVLTLVRLYLRVSPVVKEVAHIYQSILEVALLKGLKSLKLRPPDREIIQLSA